MKYRVLTQEVYTGVIEVEAESLEEARFKADVLRMLSKFTEKPTYNYALNFWEWDAEEIKEDKNETI